jgi:Acetyltransferase (GNAT) domain
MDLDDVPVAAWYGFRYAGVETFYQSGRDPGLERENIGFVLLCHTIPSAFHDGMKEYRFGLGGEPYKIALH